MKNSKIALALLVLSSFAMGGGGAGGMLYSGNAYAAGGDTGGADHHKQTVKPGETATTAGRTIKNDTTSGGNVVVTTIHPGTPGARVVVRTKSQYVGEIKGLKIDDEIHLGYGVRNTKVSGTGGEVFFSGGSSVEVKNEAPPGGSNIVATLPSGNTIEVTPGSTVTINT